VYAEFGSQPPEQLEEFAEENTAMAPLTADRTERYVIGSRQGVFDQPFRLDDHFLGVSFASPTASAFMAAASHA
jgi:hypothetical protein